jgi:hypothetical protein
VGVIQRSIVCLLSLGCIAGCGQATNRVEVPDWDPDGFADAALEKLDASGDGSLDKAELAKAPGLAWGAKYIDADKNGAVSREELVARFALYEKMRLGLTSKQIRVSLKQTPLVGAKVKLAPEFFLEGVLKPAAGEVGPDGIVDPQTEGFPYPGITPGYYRVVVESPRVKISPQYGSVETTPLGVEVSPVSDDPASYGTIQLSL